MYEDNHYVCVVVKPYVVRGNKKYFTSSHAIPRGIDFWPS